MLQLHLKHEMYLYSNALQVRSMSTHSFISEAHAGAKHARAKPHT